VQKKGNGDGEKGKKVKAEGKTRERGRRGIRARELLDEGREKGGGGLIWTSTVGLGELHRVGGVDV